MEIRHDWTKKEISEIYHNPLLELIYRSSSVHKKYHKTGEVQVCTLLSVKTGGCSEDCAYCPQAAQYHTDIDSHRLLSVETVLEKAKEAKNSGSTRFCMGAAWRQIKDGPQFDQVLEMVKGVKELKMEVCCTMGMLTQDQAKKLKNAGLTAYNHNLDSSEDYYSEIISTRNYGDRLETIECVTEESISVCSGGIIGMGETHEDRIGLLFTLSNFPVHPESVPVNALIPVKGTPLEKQKRVSIWDMVRMIATARIVMPKAVVRLSAGRVEMSVLEQAFCFMSGANSIFSGDKLLTTPNNDSVDDQKMFEILGLAPREAFKDTLPA